MSNIKSSILIVEDESYIKKVLETALAAGGYRTISAVTGAQARSAISSYMPDMVLLDLGLPDMDGVKLLKELRQWSAMPVIVVSARSTERDKILALDNGADDYITKPFFPNELMLRIKAILSRITGLKTTDVAHFEGLEINYLARVVKVDGNVISLSPKEYDLLAYLSKNNKVAISRESLLISIWGYDYYGDDRTLDTHIKLLRKSLGKYSKSISTVRGVGYRFDG